MVDTSSLQNLNAHDRIVEPDGTATPFFMRLLQRKNVLSGSLADLVAHLNAFFIHTTAPIAGGPKILGDDLSITISHAVSGVTAGTYGDMTHIPQITVDDKGHITAITLIHV